MVGRQICLEDGAGENKVSARLLLDAERTGGPDKHLSRQSAANEEAGSNQPFEAFLQTFINDADNHRSQPGLSLVLRQQGTVQPKAPRQDGKNGRLLL